MNRHKYAVSAMCRTLNISRSTYYYEAKERLSEAALEMAVINEFYSSRKNYGTRKLKAVLKPSYRFRCFSQAYLSNDEKIQFDFKLHKSSL